MEGRKEAFQVMGEEGREEESWQGGREIGRSKLYQILSPMLDLAA